MKHEALLVTWCRDFCLHHEGPAVGTREQTGWSFTNTKGLMRSKLEMPNLNIHIDTSVPKTVYRRA